MTTWHSATIVFLLLLQTAAIGKRVVDTDAIENLLKSGSVSIAIESDLNFDGSLDALVITEMNGERTLSIVYRNGDGSLRDYESNSHVLLCARCGDAFDDPLASISFDDNNRIQVQHYWGSANRTSHTAIFGFNVENDKWYLMQVKVSTFHASNPEDVEVSMLEFGKQLEYVLFSDYKISSTLDIIAAEQTAAPRMTKYDKTTGIPDEVMFRTFLTAVATPPAENIDDHKSSVREVMRRMKLNSVEDAETILAVFNSMNDEFQTEKSAFMRREVCPLDLPRPVGTEVLDRLAANDAFNDILGARFLARIQSQVAQPQYVALLSWMADLKQGIMIGRTNWHVVYADRDPDLLRQEICGRLDSNSATLKSQ